jgi:oxepin-CoA hydrolase/3-oxo-5,6-dehydrosuberyl-CoA semialdehyde dehydrogenase
MTAVLESYLQDRWQTADGAGDVLRDATTGEEVAALGRGGFDLAAALDHGRTVGQRSLRALTFQQRGQLLKELALALTEVKDELYELSYATGTTKRDAMIDVDGGIATLFAFSGVGRREFPAADHVLDGPPLPLSKDGSFLAQHMLSPLRGVSVHINAFNFPVWGPLEKFAPSFVAGVPVITKPAPQTAYLTEKLMRLIEATGVLPPGSLQMLAAPPADLLDHVTEQDIVSVTGSSATAQLLRTHPAIVANATRFVAEADSLNAAVLGPDATPGTDEFSLFVREVVRELGAKAGQKCTCIRRVIVPDAVLGEVGDAIATGLRALPVGNPRHGDTRVGALVDRQQLAVVLERIEALAAAGTLVTSPDDGELVDASRDVGAFIAPTLVRIDDRSSNVPHDVEAFGPVASLMGYRDLGDAIDLVARGRGSLVTTVATNDRDAAATLVRGIAPHNGRVYVLDRRTARSGTGHGSPLPTLTHGGPGRAGGGEELGGGRAVKHHLQRTAIQGSPDLLTAITGVYQAGAERTEGEHPFRKFFEDVKIGDAVVAGPRTITQDDIDAFAALTGDTFYAHTMPEAAAANPFFDGLVAHGYLVVAAAAGLFVSPEPGPVLANYGLERLMFQTPTYPGDDITVALTCQEKADRVGRDHGEVRWDTVVTNADGETLATYQVLTLVEKRIKVEEPAPPVAEEPVPDTTQR